MTANPYAFWMTVLSERRAKGLSRAIDEIERFEAEGLLLKVEHEGIKVALNNALDEAWSAVVRKPFCYNRDYTMSDAERKLEQALFMPYSHTVGGYLKKAEAAVKADGPMRTMMLTLLREAAPLCARAVALKEKIGKRAPAPTKTSMARDERALKAMHCQCCGRDILAETGVIAHHGYERPGGGYQTASCIGALELPLEVSRDALGRFIGAMLSHITQAKEHMEKVKAETVDIVWSWTDISRRKQPWHRGVECSEFVNRLTFPVRLDETEDIRGKGGVQDFDALKARTIGRIESEIDFDEKTLKRLQARWDGWKQTHERRDGAWVAL